MNAAQSGLHYIVWLAGRGIKYELDLSIDSIESGSNMYVVVFTS